VLGYTDLIEREWGDRSVKQDLLRYKQQAAEEAVKFIESRMVVGLGHGSTAVFALRRIAQLLKAGRLQGILGVACSQRVEEEARQAGIPLTTLDAHPAIDITIDGADEVDQNLDLIKGAGGALLREKIVAQASRREIIVIDESKMSPVLGTRRALPVEVIPFGWNTQAVYLQSLGARVDIRQANDGTFFTTDQGNFLLDCTFGPIAHPAALAGRLSERAGIVEHGLFLGHATDVIVAGSSGVRHLKRHT
jgi:ribose 5-phosphate isomerase A